MWVMDALLPETVIITAGSGLLHDSAPRLHICKGENIKTKRFPQCNAFLSEKSEWLQLAGESFICAQ